MSNELRAELDAWIDANWDPDIAVREWWQRLSSAGLTNPGLTQPFGKGWGRSETRILAAALRERGAIGSPAGLGMLLAAPMTAVLKIVLERFETTRPAAGLLAGRLPQL